jgi:endonuclease/exonuclease/phosphatase family metal-dependent hydrolase
MTIVQRPARGLVAALSLLICAALALVSAAEAQSKPTATPVKVMTRNIFLGADLSPGLAATNPEAFIEANGGILREVTQTDFPRRVRALAAEIDELRPDFVGLQEVALWRTGPASLTPVFTGIPVATDVRYDFLDLLLAEINRDEHLYNVAVVQNEFDFEAPADENDIEDDGPLPDLGGGLDLNDAELNGRLTMRDVILVRDRRRIQVENATGGHFENLLTVPVAGAVNVSVTRGWTALDATIVSGEGSEQVTREFRFVNTHLEAFDDETQTPSIRQLQAEELVAPGGPATSPDPVILLGDLNSDDDTVVPDDQKAYRALLAAGFTERSTGDPLSCCVSNLFTSPPSEFDHQVDHVMTDRSPAQVGLVNSTVTGLAQVDGIYPSDHAGVFSKLRLK